MMESRGFYTSEVEVKNLVDRFDKNKDGRISYAEVSQFIYLLHMIVNFYLLIIYSSVKKFSLKVLWNTEQSTDKKFDNNLAS